MGKSYAKANHRSPAFKASFANKIDAAVRAGQEGQTVGIPIGPDTSRVISELVAVEIEMEVRKSFGDWASRCVRYVDDMLIGIDENETEASVLSKLTASLAEYELELNGGKTELHGLGHAHAPEWVHYIRNYSLGSSRSKQREELDSYFEHAHYLADKNPQENVLLFSCKRACGLIIDKENIGHLVRWLLYTCRRAPSCLRFVAEYLAVTKPGDAEVKREIEKFILDQMPRKALAAHTEELSWLLFWAREIGLVIPDAVINRSTHLRSSVVALLTLDICESGKVSGSVEEDFWRSFCDSEGLKSEMWMVAYEATSRQWWKTPQNDDFITKHQFFADLAGKQISFYNRTRKAVAFRPAPFLKASFVQYINAASSIPSF